MNSNNLLVSFSYLLLTWMPITDFGVLFNITMTLLAIWHVILVYREQIGVRTSWLNLLALVGMGITALSAGLSNSVSLFVALMLLACQLKVLQANSKRLWRQIFVLNFFSIPCAFLFSQSLYITLFVFAFLVINLALMLQLEQKKPIFKLTKFVFSKLLFSAVLSAALIIFLPKLPAFWQLPGPNLAKTGLSEDVDPFNIAALSQSDELAFRAILSNQEQIQAPLYWRAIVHEKFDGTQWKMADLQHVPASSTERDNSTFYTIYAEPSNTPWLYGLGYAFSSTSGVVTNYFGTLYRTEQLSSTFEYLAYSANSLKQPHITRREYRRNTEFPASLNPKVQALAKQWDLKSADTAAFVTLMKNYFLQQQFSYTLTPPTALSSHVIDEFVFENKRGFCGHYAATAALMMRVAGIPARLVSGYLGAEYNQTENYYSVYQYDAHAWVEYYVPNQGWVSLDPTGWVSPERLQGSLSQLQPLSDEFKSNLGIGLAAWSNFPAINWLRLQLEQLDYQWTRWVLNFDQDKQTSLLTTLFGERGKFLSGPLIIIALSLVFLLWYWIVFLQNKVKEPLAVQHYRALLACSKTDLNQLGPKQSIAHLQAEFPESGEELDQFYHNFSANRYLGKTFNKNQNIQAKNLINSIKTKAKRKI